MKSRLIGVFLVTLCLAALSCSADTLKQLLVANQIPLTSFTPVQLAKTVQGSVKSDDRRVMIGYRQLKNNIFAGPIHLFRYDKETGSVLRPKLHLGENQICNGSPEDMDYIAGFTLLSVSVSPSADCLFVLDENFKLTQILYGFGPVEVAPGLIVMIEDMIHFAAVHPERLQLADLGNHTTSELYPPKGDALRAQLASENAKLMPPRDTCAHMNDPCELEIFDEDIRSLATDGKGRFAFIASQWADHATVEGQAPETVASQMVLYIYKREKSAWRYCEEKINDSGAEALDKALKSDFDKAASSCAPNIPVVPNMSTASYNPFLNQSLRNTEPR